MNKRYSEEIFTSEMLKQKKMSKFYCIWEMRGIPFIQL